MALPLTYLPHSLFCLRSLGHSCNLRVRVSFLLTSLLPPWVANHPAWDAQLFSLRFYSAAPLARV